MTTAKLIWGNVCRHLRDYFVYFLTLMLSVALFYAFNSVGEQPAFRELSQTKQMLYQQMRNMTAVLSVLIALVLGFLVLYANQFLLRRRKKEFGVYLLLGMGKGRLAVLFAGETVLIGLLALGAGLTLGALLSQLLALAALRMFAVDSALFRVNFSPAALRLTVLCFAVIFAVTLAVNLLTMTRLKLVDLLSAARKNQPMGKAHPCGTALVSVAGLAAVCAGLALAWQKGVLPSETDPHFQITAALLAVGTVALFYAGSLTGIRLAQGWPGFYLKGLHTFLVRQVGTRLHTNYLTMSVVCGLLAVTMVAVTVGGSTALAMNETAADDTPYDLIVMSTRDATADIPAYLAQNGLEIPQYSDHYAQITLRGSPELTYRDLWAGQAVELWDVDAGLEDNQIPLVSLSDYNTAMALQGRPGVELAGNSYLMNCNYKGTAAYMRTAAKARPTLTLADTALHCANAEPLATAWYMNSVGNNDHGSLIVPDAVAEKLTPNIKMLMAQFRTGADREAAISALVPIGLSEDGYRYAERALMNDAYFGINATVVFLCCYMGLAFLLISAALLALKQLTETADNLHRYRLLKKLGADPGQVDRALLAQLAVYFAAPLAVAAVYAAVLGAKATQTVEFFMNLHISTNVVATLLLFLLVYGGYFLATWLACRRMVREV